MGCHFLLTPTIYAQQPPLTPQKTKVLSEKKSTSVKKRKKVLRQSAGVSFDFLQDTANIDLTSTQKTTLKGSHLDWNLFYNYRINRKLTAEVKLVSRNIKAEGTATESLCRGSNQCDIDIKYTGIEAHLKSYLVFPWSLGAGFSYLLPQSKSSTALDVSSLSSSQAFILSGGYDWLLKKTRYVIPLQLHYHYYTPSASAAVQQLGLSVGFGMKF